MNAQFICGSMGRTSSVTKDSRNAWPFKGLIFWGTSSTGTYCILGQSPWNWAHIDSVLWSEFWPVLCFRRAILAFWVFWIIHELCFLEGVKWPCLFLIHFFAINVVNDNRSSCHILVFFLLWACLIRSTLLWGAIQTPLSLGNLVLAGSGSHPSS